MSKRKKLTIIKHDHVQDKFKKELLEKIPKYIINNLAEQIHKNY